MNRERERRAILEFTAFVQTPEPRPGVWTLRKSHAQNGASIPNPLKLDPQDVQEGELFVSWDHAMDFVLGRDLSEEEAIDHAVSHLQLSAKDHLSGVAIEVDVPETWLSLK